MAEEMAASGKKQPPKGVFEVRLSAPDEATLRRIADERELPFAEILSDAVKLGINSMVTAQYHVVLHRKIGLKARFADALDRVPSSKLEEAIAYLKSLDDGG